MIVRFLAIFLIILITLLPGAAEAQMPGQSGSNEPLEITADDSLEWQRDQKLFIARKNAKAVQGTTSLESALLTAKYREDARSDIEIWHITADENVILRSEDTTAYGDKATYNLDENLAVLTGRTKVLKPKPQGGTDILEADQITAYLKENAQGEQVIDQMIATGNVIITTPTEVITGKKGIYEPEKNQAELTGGVTIKRGPNKLQGERARVDLATNTSKMFGSPLEGGRVRGIFYPGSEEKPDKKKGAE